MRVAATYTENGAFVIDSQELENFKPARGETFVVDLARRRNVAFHRKGMSLLRMMYENQDKFENMTFTQFRKWVVLSAGYFETYVLREHTHVVADSLAFDKMDQTKFDEVYQAIITVAVEELGQDWAISY